MNRAAIHLFAAVIGAALFAGGAQAGQILEVRVKAPIYGAGGAVKTDVQVLSAKWGLGPAAHSMLPIPNGRMHIHADDLLPALEANTNGAVRIPYEHLPTGALILPYMGWPCRFVAVGNGQNNYVAVYRGGLGMLIAVRQIPDLKLLANLGSLVKMGPDEMFAKAPEMLNDGWK